MSPPPTLAKVNTPTDLNTALARAGQTAQTVNGLPVGAHLHQPLVTTAGETVWPTQPQTGAITDEARAKARAQLQRDISDAARARNVVVELKLGTKDTATTGPVAVREDSVRAKMNVVGPGAPTVDLNTFRFREVRSDVPQDADQAEVASDPAQDAFNARLQAGFRRNAELMQGMDSPDDGDSQRLLHAFHDKDVPMQMDRPESQPRFRSIESANAPTDDDIEAMVRRLGHSLVRFRSR